MGKQAQKPKPSKKQEETEEAKPKDLSEKAEEIKAKADDIMEEIDGILEEFEEEFAVKYVQRGGQ